MKGTPLRDALFDFLPYKTIRRPTMRKVIALFATLALLLALFACGKPAQPAEPLDLAAFAESPMAFDLTDLARFLTPPQLAGLEAALREDLAARGLEDCTALYFADPPAGCVKIPFANESGADLSNLNTEQLAKHIAGQVVEAFEGKGVDVSTTTAGTTTTGQPATTVTNASATTSNTTTATQKPTTQPPGAWTPPSQITKAELDALFPVALYTGRELTFAEKPERISVSNHEGNWEIVRARCTPENYHQGATFHVFLDKTRSGTYKYIDSVNNDNFVEGYQKNIRTAFILSRGDIKINAAREDVITDAYFYIRSDHNTDLPSVTLSAGSGIGFDVIEAGSVNIYKLNSSGTGFYEVKLSDIR